MNNNKELEVIVPLLLEVGHYVKKIYYYNSTKKEIVYKNKEQDDPVSIADLTANKMIVAKIQESFPEDNIITEEDNVILRNKVSAKRYWIIDPIDGTREFVKRSPEFCISIGLFENKKPVMGFIYNPIKKFLIYNNLKGEIFYYRSTLSFFLLLINPMHFFDYFASINKRKTFPFVKKFYIKKQKDKHKNHNKKKIIAAVSHVEYINRNFEYLKKTNFIKIVPLGSIAYKLSLIAANKLDIVISTYNKNIWDIAAGLSLLDASKKFYQHIDKKEFTLYLDKPITGTMIAGEKILVERVIKEIQKNNEKK